MSTALPALLSNAHLYPADATDVMLANHSWPICRGSRFFFPRKSAKRPPQESDLVWLERGARVK